MKGCLIGKNISYSLSKVLHEQLGSNSYDILDIEESSIKDVIYDFDFINVTIPYKNIILSYLDELTDKVKETGVCNLIINKNNKLIGYNTDLIGLEKFIKNQVTLFEPKKVLIFGTGATSKTITTLLKNKYNSKIDYVSRSSDNLNYDSILNQNLDYDYVFNATPHHALDDYFINNTIKFNNLKGAIDVNYSNGDSVFLRNIKKNSSQTIIYNGLWMLIYQALEVYNIMNIKLNIDVHNLYKDLFRRVKHLCFVGMPYSGKTTLGEAFANSFNLTLIDSDQAIEKGLNKTISNIFKEDGESFFREKEATLIKGLINYPVSILVTGGGVIENESLIKKLKKIYTVVYIKRDFDLINFDETRPLSMNKEQYLSLYNKRKELYEKYCDITIDNNSTIISGILNLKKEFML